MHTILLSIKFFLMRKVSVKTILFGTFTVLKHYWKCTCTVFTVEFHKHLLCEQRIMFSWTSAENRFCVTKEVFWIQDKTETLHIDSFFNTLQFCYAFQFAFMSFIAAVESKLLKARIQMQQKYIDQFHMLYDDFNIMKLPLLPEEVRNLPSFSS